LPDSPQIILTAKAIDNDGATTLSTGVAVTVIMMPPVPWVRFTNPVNNAQIIANTVVDLQADAGVNYGSTVRQVDFYFGGVLIHSDTSAPYSTTWRSPLALGPGTLKAVVTDTLGTEMEQSIAVMIVIPPLPTIQISSPSENDIIRSNIAVPIVVNPSAEVVSVAFYANGILLGTDTTAPFSFNWTPINQGQIPSPVKLEVVATDRFGASASDAADLFVQPMAGPLVSFSYSKNDWGGGYTGSLTITNNGSTDINGWVISWMFSGTQQITNGWNASYVQVGQSVSATNMEYNRVIKAGTSVTIGFNANYTGANLDPLNFALAPR
jgi:hypothetical protein